MERLLKNYLFDPEMTAGKMIFLTGPRQVGKTTFAQDWLSTTPYKNTYFNWDDPAVRREYTRNPLFFTNVINEQYQGEAVPLVFDEIHKHKNWRNILKGLYDTLKDRMHLLVTGSARLGLYRKSGDSLVGRYFSYQMFPLGLPEAVGDFSQVLADETSLADGESLLRAAGKIPMEKAKEGLERLLAFGGFPEPFLRGSARFHRRWQQEYLTLLSREDLRDLSRIADIRGVEQLIAMLPARVGSPLSINSLREDIGCHHQTLIHWLEVLKELYLVFTLRPWHRNILRAIKKETKLYFLDWSIPPAPGFRFENLLAVSLVRMAARFTETGLGAFEVCYVRDKEKHEVDFLLIKDNRPLALFEAKESDAAISASGRYFSRKLGVPFYQIVVQSAKSEMFPGNCFLLPAAQLLRLCG
jgi:predicted AAA+ superfamily ATPase